MDISYYKNMEPLFGEWHIKRLIGEGNFGKVFEIVREDFGRQYTAALKVITVPQNESEVKSVVANGMDFHGVTSYYRGIVEEIIDEVALMSKLKGLSNVVSYEDHRVIEHQDEIGWDILIRMELLTPLIDHIAANSMTRRDIVQLGIDVCRALEFCQKQNIIHRDIKLENIFISENGDYKLGDFGIARTIEKTSSGLSKKGTSLYMAPEVYRGEPYGASVDIYALGLVLFRLLNDNRAPFLPPYPDRITYTDMETAVSRRINGENIPKPIRADEPLCAIIQKACAYQARDRYNSPAEMRAALEQVLDSQDASEQVCPRSAYTSVSLSQEGSGSKTVRCTPPPDVKDKKRPAAKKVLKRVVLGVAMLAVVLFSVFQFSGNIDRKNEDPPAETKPDTLGEKSTMSGISVSAMPEVVSCSEKEAVDMLNALGVAAIVEEEFSADINKGMVIRASVESGEPLTAGEKVTLYVSKGPDPATIAAVTLNRSSLSLSVSDTAFLSAEGGDGSFRWSSSNNGVVTVKDGSVTAVGKGTATVTVSSDGKSASCSVTVEDCSLFLSETYLSLYIGEKKTIFASWKPSDARISWKSDNTRVATVSNGCVSAVSEGSATITASFTYGGRTYSESCSVYVEGVSIWISESSLDLSVGDSEHLSATTSPQDEDVDWSSSDTRVVTVSSNGKVVAVGGGSATITATLYHESGTYTDTCWVSVEAPSIELSDSSISMTVGDTDRLSAYTTPSGADVSWNSSNTSVISVSSSGTITAIAEGSATIKGQISIGGQVYSASCHITVTLPNYSVHVEVANTTMDMEESQPIRVITTAPSYDSFDLRSSDTSVLAVSTTENSAIVTAVGTGTADIVGEMIIGDRVFSGSCTITVSAESTLKIWHISATDQGPSGVLVRVAASSNYNITDFSWGMNCAVGGYSPNATSLDWEHLQECTAIVVCTDPESMSEKTKITFRATVKDESGKTVTKEVSCYVYTKYWSICQ